MCFGWHGGLHPKKCCNSFQTEGSGENKEMENVFCFQKKIEVEVEYNDKQLLQYADIKLQKHGII